MKKAQVALVALAAVMLISVFSYKLNTPEKRVDRLVEKHSAQITQLLDAGEPIPEDLPQFSAYQGTHPMYEHTVTTMGDTSYGCYYSPDQVPLCFQNAELELVPDVRGGWSWRDAEDNYGYTEELAPGWYYFEASF